jgi:hypothetical protein
MKKRHENQTFSWDFFMTAWISSDLNS